MITYKTGNIFDSTAQCLVNPVNCVGVMGKGLALEFKSQYPDMFKFYSKTCREGKLNLGQLGFYALKTNPSRIICLFPTKQHWKDKSTIGSIDDGLKAFVKYAPEMMIETAAFPKLGCGLGGLDFQHQVQPLFEKYFLTSKLTIEIYA
jgi:O-acetyl-ADP-ribose deacetylase (regulator of RNase III)